MNKRVVTLLVKIGEETGTVYLYPNLLQVVKESEKRLYKTCIWIEGKTARVQVVSDNLISLPDCLELAIKYMTGRYHQWTGELNADEPKWRKIK